MSKNEHILSSKLFEAFWHNPHDPSVLSSLQTTIGKFVEYRLAKRKITLVDPQLKQDIAQDILVKIISQQKEKKSVPVNMATICNLTLEKSLEKLGFDHTEEAFDEGVLDERFEEDTFEDSSLDRVFVDWIISQSLSLTEQEKKALYAFIEEATYREISNQLADDDSAVKTPERSRQIVAWALKKLRERFSAMNQDQWEFILTDNVGSSFDTSSSAAPSNTQSNDAASNLPATIKVEKQQSTPSVHKHISPINPKPKSLKPTPREEGAWDQLEKFFKDLWDGLFGK